MRSYKPGWICTVDHQIWVSHQLDFTYPLVMPILLEDLNLRKAERLLCQQALDRAGSIVEAAQLLGITRHALKRRMIKHRIEWPPVPQANPISTGVPMVRDHRPPTSPERVAPRSNPPEST